MNKTGSPAAVKMLKSPSKSPTFSGNSVAEALTRSRGLLMALFLDFEEEIVGVRGLGDEIGRTPEVNFGI